MIPPSRWLIGPPRPGPVRLSTRPSGGRRCTAPGDVAAALEEHCIDPLVRPLVEAMGRTFRLSLTVLWGNVTSAVAGAARMCMQARPDLAQQAGATVDVLLRTGPLTGTGAWVQPDLSRPRWFLARRSCCLLYRLPGAAPCGDCVLLTRASGGSNGRRSCATEDGATACPPALGGVRPGRYVSAGRSVGRSARVPRGMHFTRHERRGSSA